MAGNDQRHRIPGHSLADIARGLRAGAELLGQRAVRGDLAPSDLPRRSLLQPVWRVAVGFLVLPRRESVLARKAECERKYAHQGEAESPSGVQIEPTSRYELEPEIAVNRPCQKSASSDRRRNRRRIRPCQRTNSPLSAAAQHPEGAVELGPDLNGIATKAVEKRLSDGTLSSLP